jgi:hypothetical protein
MRQIRTVLLAIGLLVASGALAVGQKPGDWIVYQSAEGRYTVSLPFQPKLETQEATTAEGYKAQQHMAIAVDRIETAFIVAYFDLEPGMTFSIDKARDAMVKTMNGALINETELSLAGHTGREVKIAGTIPATASGQKPGEVLNVVARARFYVAGNRIYVLQMLFERSRDVNSVAVKGAKYFDSFQIVKD